MPSKSEQTKATWVNPVIRLARQTRLRVQVDGHGPYPSVGAAFRALGLPREWVKQVRAEVKAAGTAVLTHEGRTYHVHKS